MLCGQLKNCYQRVAWAHEPQAAMACYQRGG